MRPLGGVSTGTFRSRFARAPDSSDPKYAALTGFTTDEYHARDMPSEPEGATVSNPDPSAPGEAREWSARCSTCQRAVSWGNNPQRPFCSFTCRLVDLGVWFDGGYTVKGEPSDDVR
ncbi:MAG: DNA gyrase inhibitor YacG [Terriglobia bacterium]